MTPDVLGGQGEQQQAGAEHGGSKHKVERRYVARSTEEIAAAADTRAARAKR